MCYVCYATNELVQGEPRVLVPLKVRKVTYIAQTRPDPRSDYLQFAGDSTGWEIAEEVPVRRSKATEFAAANPPQVIGDKEVRYMKPKPPKVRFTRREDEDNDKGDE